MESGRRDLQKRICLNVNLGDVLYALRKKVTCAFLLSCDKSVVLRMHLMKSC